MTKEGDGGPFFAQALPPAAVERAPMPLRLHPWSAREQQFSDNCRRGKQTCTGCSSGSDSLAFGPKHEMAMLKGADSVEHAQPNLHSRSVPKNSDKAQNRAELVDLEIVISLHSYIHTYLDFRTSLHQF